MAVDYGTHNQNLWSALAGEDLSAHQFGFVVQSTTPNYYVIASTAGGLVDGILQNAPSSGQEALIAGPGSISKVMTDGTLQFSEMAVCTTGGKAAASTGQGSGWQLGRCLDGGVSLVDNTASTEAMVNCLNFGICGYRSTAN
jgi:hypothetical protein